MSRDNVTPEHWKTVAGPFGEEIAKAIATHPRPICWSVGGAAGGLNDETRSGTTFLLKCGKRPFGVTAGHVYDAHADAAIVECHIRLGPREHQRPFDLRDRLIARGRRVDLATYEISRAEIARVGARLRGGAELASTAAERG